ncbi:hypothetical protein CAEBREN_17694 [Caenorhabditis brenneri]|uniref:Uncharacterized protein n=1 Tax=Caenorhabditis brenneri TaxID=135651 RepID=G0NF98_CAEBE|nr:hypothetical protein CAEBREN_17694 [Caenorhabditis brenneri]
MDRKSESAGVGDQLIEEEWINAMKGAKKNVSEGSLLPSTSSQITDVSAQPPSVPSQLAGTLPPQVNRAQEFNNRPGKPGYSDGFYGVSGVELAHYVEIRKAQSKVELHPEPESSAKMLLENMTERSTSAESDTHELMRKRSKSSAPENVPEVSGKKKLTSSGSLDYVLPNDLAKEQTEEELPQTQAQADGTSSELGEGAASASIQLPSDTESFEIVSPVTSRDGSQDSEPSTSGNESSGIGERLRNRKRRLDSSLDDGGLSPPKTVSSDEDKVEEEYTDRNTCIAHEKRIFQTALTSFDSLMALSESGRSLLSGYRSEIEKMRNALAQEQNMFSDLCQKSENKGRITKENRKLINSWLEHYDGESEEKTFSCLQRIALIFSKNQDHIKQGYYRAKHLNHTRPVISPSTGEPAEMPTLQGEHQLNDKAVKANDQECKS